MKTLITIISIPTMIWSTDTTKIKNRRSEKQPKSETYDPATRSLGEREKNQKSCAGLMDTTKSKCSKTCCKTKSMK